MAPKMHFLIPVLLFILSVQVVGFSTLIVIRSMGFGNDLLFEQITLLTLTIFSFFCTYSVTVGKLKAKSDFFGRRFQLTVIASLLFFLSAQFTILNIDRSRSFYVLSWINLERIQIRGESYDLSKVDSPEKSNINAIAARIEEQVSRGLVISKNSELQLTRRGELVLWAAELSGDLFHLEYWESNRK